MFTYVPRWKNPNEDNSQACTNKTGSVTSELYLNIPLIYIVIIIIMLLYTLLILILDNKNYLYQVFSCLIDSK